MILGPGPSVSRQSERHRNVYNTRSHADKIFTETGEWGCVWGGGGRGEDWWWRTGKGILVK